jgi:alanyl-tRNA synthetase
MVNERVLSNAPVQTEVLSIDAARQRGAMMIFEEKYGDVVRMLTIADSVELCGGTHARATGDIGLFKIVGEQGVAAGVRRVLATTGENSLSYMRDLEQRIERAAHAARSSGGDLAEKIEKIVQHERQLEKQIDELQRKLATGGGGSGIDTMLRSARDVSGVKVLSVRTEVTDRGALRELAEQLRDKLGESVVAVGSVADDKAQLVLTVSKALSGRFKAGDLIRPLASIVGGSGGGRPDMAQAGGTAIDKLDEALDALYGSVGAAAGG